MAENEKGKIETGPQPPESLPDGFFKEVDVTFLVHELKDPAGGN